jgi:mRNA-degrading endonuclease RelE of RelBE toxin-antitoxin system
VTVTVRITKSFKTAVKPLLKKYPSLSKDLLVLESELIKNPKLGTPLGLNAFKIRLKISSKGKGKSGGARVISLVETFLIGQFNTEGPLKTNNAYECQG